MGRQAFLIKELPACHNEATHRDCASHSIIPSMPLFMFNHALVVWYFNFDDSFWFEITFDYSVGEERKA